jgi:hypothetical protein
VQPRSIRCECSSVSPFCQKRACSTSRSRLSAHPTHKVQALQQSGWQEVVLWSTVVFTSLAACLHWQQSVTCERRTAGHHHLQTNDRAMIMLETTTRPLQSNPLPPSWPSLATQRSACAVKRRQPLPTPAAHCSENRKRREQSTTDIL